MRADRTAPSIQEEQQPVLLNGRHLVWEDQAYLIPVSDWPFRARIRDVYRPYHDREILQAETEVVAAILAAIDERGDGATRKRAIAQLVEEGTLTPVHVGEKKWLYYMPTSALPWLDAELPSPRVIFLGPLDNILWDRKAVMQFFDFDYVWEVYKPLEQRRWGYYVLPVFYGDRFVARMDSRLEGKTWIISRWWGGPNVKLDAELLEALRMCAWEKR
jgi:hypothetical protein